MPREGGFAAPEAPRAAPTLSASGGGFSIVIARGGSDLDMSRGLVLPRVGALTIVTNFLVPYLIRFAWRAPLHPPERRSG
jgi:monovalent cation:H+ antiporter-2, CPA2 family